MIITATRALGALHRVAPSSTSRPAGDRVDGLHQETPRTVYANVPMAQRMAAHTVAVGAFGA
jgi:hypothetical protein